MYFIYLFLYYIVEVGSIVIGIVFPTGTVEAIDTEATGAEDTGAEETVFATGFTVAAFFIASLYLLYLPRLLKYKINPSNATITPIAITIYPIVFVLPLPTNATIIPIINNITPTIPIHNHTVPLLGALESAIFYIYTYFIYIFILI